MDIFKSISIASPGTKRAKTELRNISQTDFDNFFKNELPTLKTQSGAQGILTVITRPESPTHKFAKVLLENEEKQHDFFKAIDIQAHSLGTKRNGLFNTLIYNTTKSIDINKSEDRETLYKKIMAFLKAQKDTDIRSDDPDVADEDAGARGAHRMKNKSIFAKLSSKRLSNILKVFMVLVLCVFIVMLNEQAEKEQAEEKEAERKRVLAEEQERKEKAEAGARQKEEEAKRKKLAEEQKQKEKAEAGARQKEEERALAKKQKRKERAEAEARQKEEEEQEKAEKQKLEKQAEDEARRQEEEKRKKQQQELEEREKAKGKQHEERMAALRQMIEQQEKGQKANSEWLAKYEEETKNKRASEEKRKQERKIAEEEERKKLYTAWLEERCKEIDTAFTLPDEVTDESIKTFFSQIGSLQTSIEVSVLSDRGKMVYVGGKDSTLKAHLSEEDADKIKEKLNAEAKEKILALLKSYMEKIEIEKTVNELHALNCAEDITNINKNDVETKKTELKEKISKIDGLFDYPMRYAWKLSNELETALKSAKDEAETANTFRERQTKRIKEKEKQRKAEEEKEKQRKAEEERRRKAEEERKRKEEEEEKRRRAEDELDRIIAEEAAARKAAQPRKREELRKMKEKWWKSYKSKNPHEDTAEEEELEIDKSLKEDLAVIYGSEDKIPPNVFQQKVDTVLNNPGIIAIRGGSTGLTEWFVKGEKTEATYGEFTSYLSGHSEYADKAKIFADEYDWALTNEPRFNKRIQEDRHTVLITRDSGGLSTDDYFIDLIYLDAVHNNRLYEWYPYFFKGATKTKLKIGETEYERVPYYVLPRGIDTSAIPDEEVIKGQLKPIYMQSDVEGKKTKYVKMNITDVYDFCGKYKKMLKSKECDRIIITYQCDESKIKVSIKTNLDDVEPIVLDDTKFKKIMGKNKDRVVYRGVSGTNKLGDLRVFMKLKKEGTDHNVDEHHNQWFGPGVYWANKLKSNEGGALRYGNLVVMGLYRGERPLPSNFLVKDEYKDIFVQSTNDQIIMRSKAMYYVGDDKELEEKVQAFNEKYRADIVCCRNEQDVEKWANCE